VSQTKRVRAALLRRPDLTHSAPLSEVEDSLLDLTLRNKLLHFERVAAARCRWMFPISPSSRIFWLQTRRSSPAEAEQ